MLTTVLMAAILLVSASAAPAEVIEKTGTFGGLRLTYKVVLPNGYDAAKTYPVVLVFTGGPQRLDLVDRTISQDWRAEAERRGYIVIGPGTPDGTLFFQNAARVFPSFLDQILKDYHAKDGKLHIAGHSNGGISAFHVASLYPRYFSTLTGYPGLLDGADQRRAAALEPLCIFMHVGQRDEGWLGEMQRQSREWARAGYRVTFTVEKDQIHRLKAADINLSARMFDQIESCGRR